MYFAEIYRIRENNICIVMFENGDAINSLAFSLRQVNLTYEEAIKKVIDFLRKKGISYQIM